MSNSKYTWSFGLSTGDKTSSIDPPLEWEDFSFNLSFEELSSTELEIGELTFVNEGYEKIKEYFDAGVFDRNVYFFGSLKDSSSQDEKLNTFSFHSQFDFATIKFIDHESKLKISLKTISSGPLSDSYRPSIIDTLNATTFSVFSDESTFAIPSSANKKFNSALELLPVLVEKEDTTVEEMILYLSIYQLTVQLINAIKEIAELVGDLAALTTTGFAGFASAGVKLALQIVLKAAEITSLVIAMSTLIKRLQELLLPLPFNRWVLNVGKTIEAIFASMNLDSGFLNMDEVYDYYYLPSNTQDRTSFFEKGDFKPKVSDYGYLFSEFYEIVKNLFDSKGFYIDNLDSGEFGSLISPPVVYIGNENDDFFYKKSEYILPDILEKETSTNLGELNTKEVYTFKTDVSDEYTTKNYDGTSVEIDRASSILKPKLKDVNYQLARGTRKSEQSIIESLLVDVLNLMSDISSALGGKPVASQLTTSRIGMLKVSRKEWSVPKLLNLRKGSDNLMKLPFDHETRTNARYFQEKFDTKFASYSGRENRLVIKNARVPFDLEDFNTLYGNSVFTIKNSTKQGRITSLSWNIQGDYADIEYYIADGFDVPSTYTLS